MKACKIIAYYICEQADFLSTGTKQGKCDFARDFKILGEICTDPPMFYTRFMLKHGSFDFGSTIGYVNDTLTFYYCFHNYSFLNLDITDGSAALVTI